VWLYLLTIGHCFLPLPNTNGFTNERFELRSYRGSEGESVKTDTLAGAYDRLKWRLLNPGQVRLCAAMEQVFDDAKRGNDRKPVDDFFKPALEKLGYQFPKPCTAYWAHHRLFIIHHPSVLNRIESDLNIKPSSTERVTSNGEPIPEAQRGTSRARGMIG
jgi:hypothetical protein